MGFGRDLKEGSVLRKRKDTWDLCEALGSIPTIPKVKRRGKSLYLYTHKMPGLKMTSGREFYNYLT